MKNKLIHFLCPILLGCRPTAVQAPIDIYIENGTFPPRQEFKMTPLDQEREIKWIIEVNDRTSHMNVHLTESDLKDGQSASIFENDIWNCEALRTVSKESRYERVNLFCLSLTELNASIRPKEVGCWPNSVDMIDVERFNLEIYIHCYITIVEATTK